MLADHPRPLNILRPLNTPSSGVARLKGLARALDGSFPVMKPITLALMAACSLIMPAMAASPAPPTITILNTLGAATPATKFSVFGSAGISILRGTILTQSVGPMFTLTQETVITEIGGFLNDGDFINGVLQPPFNLLPFIVQIRPPLGVGVDPSTVLATFVLSSDNNPAIISYESVGTKLILEAGTYFAMFARQEALGAVQGGFLLESAQIPFVYTAGTTTLGVLSSDPLVGKATFPEPAAVRILGHLPTATDLLNALLERVVGEALGPGQSLAGKLKSALVALGVGNTNATCQILAAFINEVRAQTGYSLTVKQATQLITATDHIKATLGCEM
jgi:hypothetical protein